MRTPPRNTGFQHPYSSEITPKAIYEDRRQMLKLMAGGAAGAAMAAWASREAMAQQVRTLDKARLNARAAGQLQPADAQALDAALRLHLAL